MFAVPGWNVSASLLKRQEDVPSEPSAKKRKRQDDTQVTERNVADLFQQHVEKRPKAKPEPKESELAKDSSAVKPEKKKKKSKHQATDNTPAAAAAATDNAPKSNSKSKQQQQTPAPSSNPPPAKLTPLQSAMRQKLLGARFRHLNQTLYTAPSQESSQLFDSNPEFFTEYHQGFRQQVESWPENPVDTFVATLLQRGKVRAPHKHKDKGAPSDASSQPQLSALPRTNGTCKVADLGCGDAALAAKIHSVGGKLNIQVLSYDLAAPNKYITKADIANLPLQDGAVNVAIFCLALMGTNWIDFIEEAYRVLHWKGELWVAEIKSRFGRVQSRRVEHSVGLRQKHKKPSKQDTQRAKGAEDAENQQQLQAEVDEVPLSGGGTDVSTFVEVLRKRGFALQEGQSVDLDNKMFVTMKFAKTLPATKGKNVKADAKQAGMRKGKAFIDKEDESVDEPGVLKPCLYKIR